MAVAKYSNDAAMELIDPNQFGAIPKCPHFNDAYVGASNGWD